MTAPGQYLHVLALAIEPAWRARPDAERAADLADLVTADAHAMSHEVVSLSYTSVGLEPGVDLLLWRTGPAIDALESAAAALLASRLGPWLRVSHAFLGRFNASQYSRAPTDQESGVTADGHGRYLVVYPFTKSSAWYLLSREARQGIMNEHMRVGRGYPMVRQALAYAFGLDDQDFVVAYETDDLAAFGDLVRELRGTESRRSTVSDTPILVGVRRPLHGLAAHLGVRA